MSGKQRPGRFDRRAFAATVAASSGLALLVTGLGTHLAHHDNGQAGYHGWLAAHVLVALAFVLSSAWHGVLNGRALTRYVARREAVLAYGLVLLLLGLGMAHGHVPH
ncbi:MAG: hypothetical protein HZB16_18010 [Armatimonadetes bacterium]|nr:hypothetical protein [Armatimonadota bacterium]